MVVRGSLEMLRTVSLTAAQYAHFNISPLIPDCSKLTVTFQVGNLRRNCLEPYPLGTLGDSVTIVWNLRHNRMKPPPTETL